MADEDDSPFLDYHDIRAIHDVSDSVYYAFFCYLQ